MQYVTEETCIALIKTMKEAGMPRVDAILKFRRETGFGLRESYNFVSHFWPREEVPNEQT